MNDILDMLAYDGSREIKTLDDEGRFEGLAVPFDLPDLSSKRDRFSADTNFGRALKNGEDILYYHGLPTVGPREPNPLRDAILGDATFEVKTDDPRGAGVWMKGQLARRTDYEVKVWEMVKAGKLGLSTGAISHRVRREANADGTHSIKTWPIGEVSLTPDPAHYRTSVYALKTLLDDPDPESFHDACLKTVSELVQAMQRFPKHGPTRRQDGYLLRDTLIDLCCSWGPNEAEVKASRNLNSLLLNRLS